MGNWSHSKWHKVKTGLNEIYSKRAHIPVRQSTKTSLHLASGSLASDKCDNVEVEDVSEAAKASVIDDQRAKRDCAHTRSCSTERASSDE